MALEVSKYYHGVMLSLIVLIFLIIFTVSAVLYQIFHRPLPQFIADTPNGKQMILNANDEPNLSPTTLLKWANKAAVSAYTFDFVNYNKQIAAAHEYFTDAGWNDYQGSIRSLIQTISQNQLFVNGVVSGAPVIANQHELTGGGYLWRVQMPFLVTYQSANTTSQQAFMVILTIKQIPTRDNPSAIGIDQFIMK